MKDILQLCGKPYVGQYRNVNLIRFHNTYQMLALLLPVLYALFGHLFTSFFYSLAIGYKGPDPLLLFAAHAEKLIDQLLLLLSHVDITGALFLLKSAEYKPVFLAIFLHLLSFGALVFYSPWFQLFEVSLPKGQIKWASFQLVRSSTNLLGYGGMMLGYMTSFFGKLVPLTVKNPLSMLVLAPPGTGKTASIIVPSLLNDENSAVVFDVKGELFDKTSKYRGTLGPVMFIDPDHFSTVRWNPLSYRTLPLVKDYDGTLKECHVYRPDGTLDDLALGYIDNMVSKVAENLYPSKGEKEPFWPLSAQMVFHSIAMAQYLLYGDATIPRINQMSSPDKDNPKHLKQTEEGVQMMNRQEVLVQLSQDLIAFLEKIGVIKNEVKEEIEKAKQIRQSLGSGKEQFEQPRQLEGVSPVGCIISQLMNIGSYSEQTFNSVLQTLDVGLKPFKNPIIANMASDSDFSFSALRGDKGRPVTLYLRIRQSDVPIYAPYVKTMLEMIADFILDVKWKKDKGEKLITFYLDEFTSLGKMPRMLELPKLSRGQGGRVLFVAQDYGQIENIYQRDLAQTVYTVNAYMGVFTQNSFETAEKLSKRFGNTTVLEKRRSFKSGGGAHDRFSGADLSFEESSVSFVSPEAIMAIPPDQVFFQVQMWGTRPLKLKTALNLDPQGINSYYIDKEIAKRHGTIDKETKNYINYHREKANLGDVDKKVNSIEFILDKMDPSDPDRISIEKFLASRKKASLDKNQPSATPSSASSLETSKAAVAPDKIDALKSSIEQATGGEALPLTEEETIAYRNHLELLRRKKIEKLEDEEEEETEEGAEPKAALEAEERPVNYQDTPSSDSSEPSNEEAVSAQPKNEDTYSFVGSGSGGYDGEVVEDDFQEIIDSIEEQ